MDRGLSKLTLLVLWIVCTQQQKCKVRIGTPPLTHHTHTHTQARACTHARARAHARTHARTHTHSHTHTVNTKGTPTDEKDWDEHNNRVTRHSKEYSVVCTLPNFKWRFKRGWSILTCNEKRQRKPVYWVIRKKSSKLHLSVHKQHWTTTKTKFSFTKLY